MEKFMIIFDKKGSSKYVGFTALLSRIAKYKPNLF